MHFWHGTPDVIVLFLTHQNIRSKISQKGVVSIPQHDMDYFTLQALQSPN